MTTSIETILCLFNQRRKDNGPLLNKMREIKAAYEGDIIVPLPELDTTERVAVANLLQSGLDQTAMRISSVLPDLWYPSTQPGQEKAEKAARRRRQVNQGWWYENKMGLKLRRRARHMIGYSSTPVMIRPNFDTNMPEWVVRDPLNTYPSPALDPDEMTPQDCIFTYTKSLAWLEAKYPGQTGVLYKGHDPKPDDLFELIEYIDAEEWVLGCLGKQRSQWDTGYTDALNGIVELERVDNKAGICLAVVPGRITLGKRIGQFDGMIGLFQLQARLMALEVIAVQKGVFPEKYLISNQGETASFIAGPFDGESGMVNIIKGGTMKEIATQPGFQTNPTIDRLERSQRISGGVPAEYGGESTTNVRTGKRGDAILSAVVDFPIQEAQKIFEESLKEENKRAIAIDKAYFNFNKSFYVSWKGSKGQIEYKPSDLFENDVNYVTYSHAGSDINSLVVGIGQRVGIGTLSKRSAQELDPMIDDPELEHDRITAEGLEAAMMSSIQTLASNGQLPPSDVARIMELVKTDKMELAEAIQQVQKEAQARQASNGPPGTPEAPVDPNSPEAQAGIAQPGAGAEAGTVAPPPTGLGNVAQLFHALHATAPNQSPGGGPI